jgi:hypothetical protein
MGTKLDEKLFISFFLILGLLIGGYTLFNLLSGYTPDLQISEKIDIIMPSFFTTMTVGIFLFILIIIWRKK